jgi:hypothetical protein
MTSKQDIYFINYNKKYKLLHKTNVLPEHIIANQWKLIKMSPRDPQKLWLWFCECVDCKAVVDITNIDCQTLEMLLDLL